MTGLEKLRETANSLEGLEFSQYCKRCGKWSEDCKCNMGRSEWLACNKDMRAYPKKKKEG